MTDDRRTKAEARARAECYADLNGLTFLNKLHRETTLNQFADLILSVQEKALSQERSFLLSCPWCHESTRGWPASKVIPHLIAHGDQAKAEMRRVVCEVCRWDNPDWTGQDYEDEILRRLGLEK